MFDLDALKKETTTGNRYERRLAKLVSESLQVDRIKAVVENAVANIDGDQRSFVVYGEPQSGKTEMMIALTAKLLDRGFKLVIVLLNDSVQLLGQNLERFQRSGIAPAPKKFSEILPPEIAIGEHQWVIFCKKNSKDLQKLLEKIEGHPSRVVVDDEADYATPNSKINNKEKSAINKLTEKLIGKVGTYIGVTATPARLDLNRTHGNQNDLLKSKFANVFLVLVCNDDGVVCLSYSELKSILDDQHDPIEWISATRHKREMYSVKGSNGELQFKIGQNEFPEKIFRG